MVEAHPRQPIPEKVNLAAALATFEEPWSPRIVGRYNGNKVFLAKAKGSSFGTHTPTRMTCSSSSRGE